MCTVWYIWLLLLLLLFIFVWMCMCVRLPDDGREEDGSFRGSAAAAAAYNVQVFSSILLLVTSRGACSHGLAPPGRRRRRRSSRTQLTAPVVVGWWIASCASPIWTCTRKSMSTPLLYVYVHTYIHVPCSTGSPPYHPRTQSTEYPLMPSFSRRRL